MDEIKELQWKRFKYLEAVYKYTHRDRSLCVNMHELGKELGFDPILTGSIVCYLIDEELIESQALGGIIRISHWGIKEIETVLTRPAKPTPHFPANIIHVNTMINSQIQQSSPGAVQVVTINDDERNELKAIIKSLKDQINELKLQPEDKNDLKAEINTIEAQLSSSRPKKSILIESLKSILSSAAGSLLASGLIQQISTWIEG